MQIAVFKRVVEKISIFCCYIDRMSSTGKVVVDVLVVVESLSE